MRCVQLRGPRRLLRYDTAANQGKGSTLPAQHEYLSRRPVCDLSKVWEVCTSVPVARQRKSAAPGRNKRKRENRCRKVEPRFAEPRGSANRGSTNYARSRSSNRISPNSKMIDVYTTPYSAAAPTYWKNGPVASGESLTSAGSMRKDSRLGRKT